MQMARLEETNSNKTFQIKENPRIHLFVQHQIHTHTHTHMNKKRNPKKETKKNQSAQSTQTHTHTQPPNCLLSPCHITEGQQKKQAQ